MITHVPMAVHPDPKKVLVIGAGDGGVIRELTRYETVKHIDMVEIDPLVVEVCRRYLPQTSCRLDDERVHIHYEDGLKFIRNCLNAYDLIIVDSTDRLVRERPFYARILRKLLQSPARRRHHGQPARKSLLRGGCRCLSAGPPAHR
jgi:spermidine synthase